jgi:hypothetical protein
LYRLKFGSDALHRPNTDAKLSGDLAHTAIAFDHADRCFGCGLDLRPADRIA